MKNEVKAKLSYSVANVKALNAKQALKKKHVKQPVYANLSQNVLGKFDDNSLKIEVNQVY